MAWGFALVLERGKEEEKEREKGKGKGQKKGNACFSKNRQEQEQQEQQEHVAPDMLRGGDWVLVIEVFFKNMQFFPMKKRSPRGVTGFL